MQALKITRLIPRMAVRAFEHVLSFTDREKRDDEKQGEIISAGFFDELPERAATLAAHRFRRLL
jgi:hypothetical protein